MIPYNKLVKKTANNPAARLNNVYKNMHNKTL